MANKDKILLMAMISMLLPGAMQEAYAESESKTQRKTDSTTKTVAKRNERQTSRAAQDRETTKD